MTHAQAAAVEQVGSFYCFVLKCHDCQAEIRVGPTQEFEEKGTGKQMGYYDPETGRICGVSQGSGDTFECMPCRKMGEGKKGSSTMTIHSQAAAVRAVKKELLARPHSHINDLYCYFQSPPARRVEVNASFKPCYPADKMLRVVNAKQYCEKTYDS